MNQALRCFFKFQMGRRNTSKQPPKQKRVDVDDTIEFDDDVDKCTHSLYIR